MQFGLPQRGPDTNGAGLRPRRARRPRLGLTLLEKERDERHADRHADAAWRK